MDVGTCSTVPLKRSGCAASSQTTLELLTIIAVIGLPLVATYTAIVYWVFRGKVKLGKLSY